MKKVDTPQNAEEKKVKTEPQKTPIKISISKNDIERMRLKREDVDFVADSKTAIFTKKTPLLTATLLIIAAFLLIGVIWASFANIDEITRGIGKVVPSSQVQIIQNLEGGILSKIFVTEGQKVKKGQPLAQLDSTMFAAQYNEGYAKWLALQATIARLKAQTENKTRISFPPEVLKSKELVKHETNLFASKQELINDTMENLNRSYKLANEELQIIEPLVAEGIISKIELLRLQRELATIKGRIDANENDFRERAFTELTRTKANANMLAEKLTALKDRMQRTTLISPVDGIVKQIHLNTKGGILKPAMPIMEIVPLNDQLIIEALVQPSDIGFIKIGQKAKVKITAYDYAVYGDLSAVVTNIGADTNIDQRGNSFYEVTLKTDKNYLGNKKGNFPIVPGMMAVAEIITGKKSVMTYLMMPIIRAKEKAMRER